MSDSIRPSNAVEAVEQYSIPKHGAPIDLRLDRNEGAGPSSDIIGVLSDGGSELLRRYVGTAELEGEIARKYELEPERVIVTAGGDDAIARALRSVMMPGREIIVPKPTFEMIEKYARLAGGEVVSVDWREGSYPLDAIVGRVNDRTAAIAVVTPNNPTGLVATSDDLRRLSKAAPSALILVDLAYTEFAEEDLTGVALSLPNAVIVRTLSKAWGLAGLRVGWAAGSATVISWMRAAGNPYAVSSASLALAGRVLADGGGVDEYVVGVRSEVRRAAELIEGLGGSVLPSQANFVLARFEDAGWVRDGLAGLGISVRAFPDKPELENSLRITMPGDEADFERLANGLKAVIAPEAILFDIDDTLADVTDSYRRAAIATAKAFGVVVTFDDISNAKAAGDANNDWELTWRLITAAGVDVALEDVIEIFEDLYQGVEGMPGLKTTEKLMMSRDDLSVLAQRFKLGIVTGRPGSDALEFITREGIADLFGAVVTMDDGPLKPDPAPVRIALARLGVGRAWMVGDTPDDMRAARGAGVVPIGVVAPSEDPVRSCGELTAAGASRVLTELKLIKEMLP